MWPLQARLGNGIWHTTHPERFSSIMAQGLRADPAIPNSGRWKTSRGPEFYPFVRILGGVSLFDFAEFDAQLYEQSHPMSNWTEFVPHREAWGGAVWIQIDRNALGCHFISADDLVRRWDEGGYHRHTIMPRIECACIGDIPVSAFVSAFITWSNAEEIRDLPVEGVSGPEYNVTLGDWQATLSRECAQ